MQKHWLRKSILATSIATSATVLTTSCGLTDAIEYFNLYQYDCFTQLYTNDLATKNGQPGTPVVQIPKSFVAKKDFYMKST
jgi:hypothetical protein